MNKVRCTYCESEMEPHFSVGKEYIYNMDQFSTDPNSMIVIGEDRQPWYAERLDDKNAALLGMFVKFEFI